MEFDESPRDSLQDVEKTLGDYTLSCILDQPEDLLSYSINFFTKLRERQTIEFIRHIGSSKFWMISEASLQHIALNIKRRRHCVFAETFNPEIENYEIEPDIEFPKTEGRRTWLKEALKKTFLFRNLDTGEINEVIDATFEVKVKENETIIEEGKSSDNFYVVEEGMFTAYVMEDGKQVPIKKYEDGDSFGELALLYDEPLIFSVVANKSGILWAVARSDFKRIMLKGSYGKGKTYARYLKSVLLLRKFSHYNLMNLADALVTKTYNKSDVIVKEGEKPDGIYFVEQGKVSIAARDLKSDKVTVTTVKEGGHFGELVAPLTTQEQTATLVTAEEDDVKLAFLDADAFDRLAGTVSEDVDAII